MNILIIKLPKIRLNGNKLISIRDDLSLFSILEKIFFKSSIINLVAGDGFEPPTFRL